jgi:MFS family permease
MVGFVAFTIACALAPSLESLIAFRLLQGALGSCFVTNAGASIADMVPSHRRGTYLAAVSAGTLLGPIIGPVIAGFLNDARGWRWIFWLVTIVGGAAGLAMLALGRETYHPLILQRKVDRLRKLTGNPKLRHRLDDGLTPAARLRRGIVRPVRLFWSPIGIVCALYMTVVYGYLYLMFSSVTTVFQDQYNIRGKLSGLVFLGLGLGNLIGMVLTSVTTDRAIKNRIASGAAAGPGDVPPEVRLTLTPYGSVLLPAGLFIYGWTAQYKVHWIVPIIGMAVMGVGNMIIFLSISLYLIDCYGIFSASALAANTVVRSIGGGVLPLAGLRMFSALGIGWGTSLLGFIAVAMIPIPILILRFGERLRRRQDMTNL